MGSTGEYSGDCKDCYKELVVRSNPLGREGAKSSVSTGLGGLQRTPGGGRRKFSRRLFWGRKEKTSGGHARGASGSQAGGWSRSSRHSNFESRKGWGLGLRFGPRRVMGRSEVVSGFFKRACWRVELRSTTLSRVGPWISGLFFLKDLLSPSWITARYV